MICEDGFLPFERILSADNLPIIYEHIYIPTDFLPDFQVEKLENGSLTRLLNKEYHMKESEKARSTVEVSTVSQPVAGYLRMNEGEPVMILASYRLTKFVLCDIS